MDSESYNELIERRNANPGSCSRQESNRLSESPTTRQLKENAMSITNVTHDLINARSLFAQGEFLKAARLAYTTQQNARQYRTSAARHICVLAHELAITAADRAYLMTDNLAEKSEANRIRAESLNHISR